MKHLISLTKVELLTLKRESIYFLLSIGMPSAFYILFSGLIPQGDNGAAATVYLFSMTIFSIMSTAFFSIPSDLYSNKVNNWQKLLYHSPVSVVEYYISKFLITLISFTISIIGVFSVGHFVRNVNLPLLDWIVVACIILVGSIVFIAMGVMLTLLPSIQLMSVIGNIVYMFLAVVGGLWFPLSMMPNWLQSVGKTLPSYHLVRVVSVYLEHHTFSISSILVILAYTVVVFSLTILLKKRIEVK